MTGIYTVVTGNALHRLFHTEDLGTVLKHYVPGLGCHLHHIGQQVILLVHTYLPLGKYFFFTGSQVRPTPSLRNILRSTSLNNTVQ